MPIIVNLGASCTIHAYVNTTQICYPIFDPWLIYIIVIKCLHYLQVFHSILNYLFLLSFIYWFVDFCSLNSLLQIDTNQSCTSNHSKNELGCFLEYFAELAVCEEQTVLQLLIDISSRQQRRFNACITLTLLFMFWQVKTNWFLHFAEWDVHSLHPVHCHGLFTLPEGRVVEWLSLSYSHNQKDSWLTGMMGTSCN